MNNHIDFSKPRYCNAGIKWFVIKNNNIYPCHPIENHLQTLYDLENEKLKIRENTLCSINCNGGCEIGQCPMSNTDPNIVSNNKEITIVIYTSNYCPQDCPFCFHITTEKKKSWEIYIPGLLLLFKQLNELYQNHKYRILFTGGEPLLDNNFENILKLTLSNLNVSHIRLYTSLPQNSKIKKIIEQYPIKNKLYISISCHPGGKIFNLYKFIEGIDYLKNNNVKLNVHMVDHPINEPFSQGLRELFDKMNIEFYIAKNMKSDNYTKNNENIIYNSLYPFDFTKL